MKITPEEVTMLEHRLIEEVIMTKHYIDMQERDMYFVVGAQAMANMIIEELKCNAVAEEYEISRVD